MKVTAYPATDEGVRSGYVGRQLREFNYKHVGEYPKVQSNPPLQPTAFGIGRCGGILHPGLCIRRHRDHIRKRKAEVRQVSFS